LAAPIIHHSAEIKALVVAKGHPYERDPFMSMFEAMAGVDACLVEHPAAQGLLNAERLAEFDTLVLYDMPGLDFAVPDGPGYVEPSDETRAGFEAALRAGIGVVAMHHAIAGWPSWSQYGAWLGGRFLYRPGRVGGRTCPDSGYRHDVTHTISKRQDLDGLFAPILDGVPDSFALKDELYLFEVFEDEVYPLLRSDHVFAQENFYSANLAVQGEMFSNRGWSHAPGSNLIAWAKTAEQSPLVYIQCGDGPDTYNHPVFRKLLENAVRWACSEEALAWARAGQSGRGPE